MKKYAYEELNKIYESYENLRKAGIKQNLEFHIIGQKDFGGYEKMQLVKYLIAKMPSFNNKDNIIVARHLEELFLKLPREYYNEGNPNNDNFKFSNIILKGDDTILLKTYFAEDITNDEENYIESLIKDFAKKTKADEYDLMSETGYKGRYYTIRLWWD